MEANRKPLRRSIFLFILGFITLLCLALSILTYTTFTNSLYKSYDRRMTDILNHVKSHIDIEDLSNCVETEVESEKFTELMSFMDSIMEDFDIHYLYIVKPIMEPDRKVMMNVLSADTAYGRETDPDGYYLGFIMDDVYEEKDLLVYQKAIEKDTISYFKNFSTWGYDYTAALPLINAKGEHFALLCVDIEVEDVQMVISTYTAINIVLIVFLGILFGIIFLMWMNHNITVPIKQLEASVVSFAKRSHEQPDPDLLDYEEPNIHTDNEVESLSHAVTQMSSDMRLYAQNVHDAEDKVEDMKSQVSYMDTLAYQDALTHVKNKAWYDETEKHINAKIADGTAQFAILMADLNNLKKINDNFGHEHGNQYILGASNQICVTFNHSPVFRVGGDEFVVILENTDYDEKEELVERLKKVFAKTSTDEKRAPWNRYSVAMGLAVYDCKRDSSMNDVFRRADDLMYKDKMLAKKAHK